MIIFRLNNSILPMACLTLLLLSATHATANDQSLDSIAAVVNGDVIMLSEVQAAAQQAQSQQTNNNSSKSLLSRVLDKLVMDKIQVQKAKSLGMKIDDAAVDTAMQTIAKQNNLNLQQLRKAMIQQGINYKGFRENIRDRLYADNLRKRQQARNKVGDNDVSDLIQAESFNLSKDVQYQLIDILIPHTTNSVAQFNVNIRRAHILRNKLLSNGKLSQAEIAKLGGTQKDLGWQKSESLSPSFSRSLSLLGEGELSNVIRDKQGFHILKLVKQRGGQKEQVINARVRHILISNDDPQAKLKASQLRNRILAGENFAQLARQHSVDKGSAVNGGELPMANTAKYVPPFMRAANNLAVNSLSQPIETQFGWHIIEVLERNKSDSTRESIKNKAKDIVSSRNQENEMQNWLKSLRDEAFVEYRIKL